MKIVSACSPHDPDDGIAYAKTLQLAREGSPQGWQRIWIRYVKRVHRHIQQLGIRAADTDDITVEVFLKVWLKFHQFSREESEQSLDKWILRITRTTTIDFLRKQHREVPTAELDRVGLASCNDNSGEDKPPSILEEVFWEAFRDAERAVSKQAWECFRLARLDGWKHADIAAKLNTTEANVGTICNRVLKRLRDIALERLLVRGFELHEGKLQPWGPRSLSLTDAGKRATKAE
jgi:RNA polymerase sigma factor (sigma-70 family)